MVFFAFPQADPNAYYDKCKTDFNEQENHGVVSQGRQNEHYGTYLESDVEEEKKKEVNVF